MPKALLDSIVLRPHEDDSFLEREVRQRVGETYPFHIERKSIDARNKRDVKWRYRLILDIPEASYEKLLTQGKVEPYVEPTLPPLPEVEKNIHVVIIGAGPAGLFAALRLMDAGAEVTVLERGKAVKPRMEDITRLEESGELDVESNVLFGEGGAGTYSDGKLTTGTSRPANLWVREKMIEFGAPGEIRYMTRPHIGTERVRALVARITGYLREHGARVEYGACVDDMVLQKGRVKSIHCVDGRVFHGDAVMLATGHSARDIYELLDRKEVPLGVKGFAVGLRVEHSADFINRSQYGSFAPQLPAAEYKFADTNRENRRGTYSFCMCPGGEVVNSSSEMERLCVNGMSYAARNGRWSNAAFVTSVFPEDVDNDVHKALSFQRTLEEAAYQAGGGSYVAPAQRLTDFLSGRNSSTLPEASYRRGIAPARVDALLPPWIMSEMRRAFPLFNRRIQNFISSEALVMGLETRTSSPLRIIRGDDGASLAVKNLFPAGEGAGYSGGIMSSAADGMRGADAVLRWFVSS